MTLATSNPLLTNWDTPHGLPPFDAIRAEHFKPAFDAAFAEHRAELDAIAANPAPADFDNTLAAFDRAGRLLARLDGLFYNLTASETSPALQAVERELAGPVAAHSSAIYMHATLFKRIDDLHERRQSLALNPEQLRLLERVHLDFVRAGAKLDAKSQARYKQVMERLAELSTTFAQNVLADESSYRLVLRTEDELAGLPDFVRAAARQAAAERGIADAHVITLSRSHIVPFLTFSSRRDLREQAYKAWTSRGEHAGTHDNRPIAREILDHVLARINRKARIIICGAISQYNNTTAVQGPKNYLSLLVNRARMEGIVVFDYADRYHLAVAEMAGYLKEGRMKSKEDVVQGLETFPETLMKLFRGENFGKLVLQVAK